LVAQLAITLLVGLCISSAVHAGDPPTPAGKVRIVPPDGDGAKYWSRWRGPSGRGVVADGPYPDNWSAKENVRWKIEVPGKGRVSVNFG